mmetsp:Transcript_58832/g.65889  ORF Transcript_58832/g.65889 Transcript_58832/m.65889 type:complete len:205 (-) Transcript_58832:909-1523(-)
MLKVLLFPGVDGVRPIRPPIVSNPRRLLDVTLSFSFPSLPLLLEGIIGGLPFLLFPTGTIGSLFVVVVLALSGPSTPASDEVFLFFPNIPLRGFRKLLAKLPVSLSAGVGGTDDITIEFEVPDFVLEGRRIASVIFNFGFLLDEERFAAEDDGLLATGEPEGLLDLERDLEQDLRCSRRDRLLEDDSLSKSNEFSTLTPQSELS